ncbi:MAG: hypothetical protein SFW09_04220 [Hyphomicrobiaceae bacterium]|nr:hypothetical protein [Hyphomicrobiaceae bacterium]
MARQKRRRRADGARPTVGMPSVWLAALHDLRQPLQAAQLLADVVATTEDAAVRERSAGVLSDSLACLDEMLQSLARLTRLECGEMTPSLAPVDLGAVLDEIAASAGLPIDVEARPATDLWVMADRAELMTILRGIVLNGKLLSPEHRPLKAFIGRRVGRLVLDIEIAASRSTDLAQEAMFVWVPLSARQADGASFAPGLGLIDRLATAIGVGLSVKMGPGHVFRLSLSLPARETRRSGGHDR